ncbi:PhoD-like phosphatase-domain-containing protein [Russula brevipes]|nr:PhoD-like phosphatase-domain-containing protein [Russula brevipes]
MSEGGKSALYLGAIFSTLFRVFAYIFLRVSPLRWCRYLLPGFYFAYIATVPLAPRLSKRSLPTPPPPPSDAKEDESTPAVTQNEPSSEANHDTDVFWELLFSLPTTRLTSFVTWSINTVLILLAADFVFAPFLGAATGVTFTRVGAVYPDAAKVVVRYPFSGADATDRDVLVLLRPATATAAAAESWIDGPTLRLQQEFDWTNTTKLTSSGPLRNTNVHLLAHTNKTLLPYPASPIRFRTFPDPRLPTGSHFRFVVSSCIKPNFPYAPFNNRRIRGFDLLADYLFAEPASVDTPGTPIPLENHASPAVNESIPAALPAILEDKRVAPAEFMLFLGDFIYADVPVYHGDSKRAYRRLYRRNYDSPSFRKVFERLRTPANLHASCIINNYIGQSNDTPPFVNADDAFRIYNADANYDPLVSGQRYYDFRHGDVAFFVMDTRRHRSDPITGEAATRTMLGEAQLSALYEWLGKVNQTTTFKFIITSVPFTSLWTHDAQTDSWAGYASEKASLLSALHTVPNVYLLSGDRHEFAAIEFNPLNEVGVGAHVVREFSTSPLSMFYVPLVRTLRAASEAVVPRKRLRIVSEESPPEEEVEEVPVERVVKYLPIGNYKWSAIEIDTRNLEHPKLNLEVVIDGKVAYNLSVDATPVKLRSSTALGSMVSDTLKDILDRVGLSPNRWF